MIPMKEPKGRRHRPRPSLMCAGSVYIMYYLAEEEEEEDEDEEEVEAGAAHLQTCS